MDNTEIRQIMKNIFGYEDFKSPVQEQSVHAVLSGAKNIVVSMPTMAGKSLCFHLPSMKLLRETFIQN